MHKLDGTVLRRAIQRCLDAGTVAKGRAYQQQRKVADCELSPELEAGWTLEASVRGSRPRPYKVRVEILRFPKGAMQLEGECSCPMGFDCKHVAAALLELATQLESTLALDFLQDLPAEEEDDDPDPMGIFSAPSQPPAKALVPDLQFWLQRVAQAMAAPTSDSGTTANKESSERVLYILRPADGRLKLELFIARVLEKGGYGQARTCTFYQLVSTSAPIPAARPADVQLGRRIILAQPSINAYEIYLEGAAGAELMPEILATGHCHIRGCGKKHPVLTLGAARPAVPVWRLDDKGFQRPALQIEPAAADILPFSPPWFVDETKSECGPLETSLSAALVTAWLGAPMVPPETAQALAAGISALDSGLSLPAPRAIEVLDLPRSKPATRLRLYSARFKKNSYGWPPETRQSEHELSFARLEFDYAGMRTAPVLGKPVLESFSDGQLRRVQRDINLEKRAMRKLEELGMRIAQEAHYAFQLGAHSTAHTFEKDMDWVEFVHTGVPELREKGWEVELDETFQFHLVEPEDWFTDAIAEAGGHDWFGVELGVIVEGQKVNLLPVLLKMLHSEAHWLTPDNLAALADTASFPVSLPDGRKLMFPAGRAKQMLGALLELLNPVSLNPDGQLRLPKLRALEFAGEANWRWLGTTELRELAGRLRSFAGIQPVPPPQNLGATLRPYQQEGLNWLQFLREYELGGVLADDMGLGKTIQTLAHLLVEKQSGRMDRPSLVIAPTSLMTNWRQESARFAPDLRVLVLHGQERKQDFDQIATHDLIVTSYPLLPRDQAVLLGCEFHYVILDEAQFIKNPKTQYARIACALKARHHLCLTGTPMENHLGELWSLFHFLLPGFLGDEIRFNSVFRRPIEKGNNNERRQLLARRVNPFILRRKKSEVLTELPPKTEIVRNVELTGAQRDLYESVRLAMHQRVKAEVAKKGLSRAHIIILDALLKLRQICCHPQLLSLPSAQKVKASAKLELLLDLLPEMIAEGRRILLFSQFTSMLAIIQTELAERKIPYVLLTGDTRDRATPVASFQNGEVPLFLISLKAGGTGLNLTAADTVIHYDPWWNPAVENQATDRAHRIGQEKNVFVYKLLTVGTVEEKIAAMQARKRELVESLLNDERRENLKLAPEDLEVLFAPLEG